MKRRSTPPSLTRVRSLATSFRDAIEKCDLASLGITFTDFPRGSCGDVALLLGTFLIENGERPFTEMFGEWGPPERFESHAWIERNGVVVDITADQFDGNDRVIVTKKSAWHDSHRTAARGNADFRTYDQHTSANLARSYAIIRSRVREAV